MNGYNMGADMSPLTVLIYSPFILVAILIGLWLLTKVVYALVGVVEWIIGWVNGF